MRATSHIQGFPSDSVVKNVPDNAGDAGSVSRLGRSPGEGNSNALQYSYLGNAMDRGACWVTVHGVCKRFIHNLAVKQQEATCDS